MLVTESRLESEGQLVLGVVWRFLCWQQSDSSAYVPDPGKPTTKGPPPNERHVTSGPSGPQLEATVYTHTLVCLYMCVYIHAQILTSTYTHLYLYTHIATYQI